MLPLFNSRWVLAQPASLLSISHSLLRTCQAAYVVLANCLHSPSHHALSNITTKFIRTSNRAQPYRLMNPPSLRANDPSSRASHPTGSDEKGATATTKVHLPKYPVQAEANGGCFGRLSAKVAAGNGATVRSQPHVSGKG